MFGTVLNSAQVEKKVADGEVSISKFQANKMDGIHYPLFASQIFINKAVTINGDVEIAPREIKIDKKIRYCEMEPDEYVLAQMDEHIVLKNGLVAHFVQPFSLVERGFQIITGRLGYPFGTREEKLIFGLKNLLNRRNTFDLSRCFCYAYFVDISGLADNSATQDAEDIRKLLQFQKYMRERDSGVSYE